MIFCLKRLRDFLCEKGFLVKKKFSGETVFFLGKQVFWWKKNVW